MDNFTINGMPVSEKQYLRIKNMRRLSDDEIDFSDIPETTHEEFERAIARKRAKLREKNLKIAG